MTMTNELLLLMVLLVLTVGVLPTWPYSGAWGYRPSRILAILLLFFFILVLAQHRPFFRSTGEDIKAAVQDAGADIKAVGRDTADSIRRAVQ